MPGWTPYRAFFVSAITEDPYLFFESNVDSGYSVDNLAPIVPKGMRGVLLPGSGDLLIHWNPNPEPDLHHYNVYRGHFPGFEATPTTLIASPPDTMYVDADFGPTAFYRVSAVDIHGNESRPPALVPVGATQSAFSTWLHAPFEPGDGGAVVIRYDIGPGDVLAKVEIFDVVGRRVRVLENTVRRPGQYTLRWDRRDDRGAPVSRGLYLVRLAADGRQHTHKLVILRN
jgi:hypothetical protein